MSVTSPAVLADAALPRVSTGVRNAILVLGGAAFVGLAAQVVIPLPFTPVPLTLQTFAVLLTGAAVGMRRAAAAMGIYLIASLAGVPWMANQGTAIREGALVPTFGYVVGFVAAAAVLGVLAQRGWTRSPARTAAAFAAGSAIIYAFGVSWLKVDLGMSWAAALSAGMVPFLVGDAIKVLAAGALLPAAWAAVQRFVKD